MSCAYGDGQNGVIAQMRAEPAVDECDSHDNAAPACHGSIILQVAHYAPHGVHMLEKHRNWTMGDAREQLAQYIRDLRAQRTFRGDRAWYIKKDGPRTFYCARITSLVGYYQIASIVHAVPATTVKADEAVAA